MCKGGNENRVYHVGIVNSVDNNGNPLTMVEAKGKNYGVVRTKWTKHRKNEYVGAKRVL